MTYTIIIGNKNYSSWSMRPWLVLDHFGLPYEEKVIPLDTPETRSEILLWSPAGKVPVLVDRSLAIWDSLAIIEYLGESEADVPIWPQRTADKAQARSLCAEMHSGFVSLRTHCPMNLKAAKPARRRGDAQTERDVDRFEQIVRDRLMRSGGPFLYGAWSAADAFYAPLTTRLTTYQWEVADETRAYIGAVQEEASFKRWKEAAVAEPWSLQATDLVR